MGRFIVLSVTHDDIMTMTATDCTCHYNFGSLDFAENGKAMHYTVCRMPSTIGVGKTLATEIISEHRQKPLDLDLRISKSSLVESSSVKSCSFYRYNTIKLAHLTHHLWVFLRFFQYFNYYETITTLEPQPQHNYEPDKIRDKRQQLVK